MVDLTIAEVQEAVAKHVPDRDCIVQGGRHLSYRQFNERSRRLANYLMQANIGCRRPRSELEAWESGQDHVGLYMHNCAEYLECEFGIPKARAAAVNINFRYVEKELHYLCQNANLRGIVYESEFACTVAALCLKLPELRLLIQVRDNSAAPLLAGAIWYEDALAAGSHEYDDLQCALDDLHILYTGGTTGQPKGVLWRQADIVMAALGGRRPNGMENALTDFLECAEKTASRTLPAGPFMHASGRWPAMAQVLLGNTVVIPANTRRLDADDIWSTVERERVAGINIAGDAFARPLLDALEKYKYDLSALRLISSGAAVLSAPVKRELLRRLPRVAISDTIGASETGPQASSMWRAGDEITKPQYSLTSSTTVISVNLSRVVPNNSDEIGWLARSGRVPLGYLNDPIRTKSTFPEIGGIRYAIPGDRARWGKSGGIELLGRDATTINSGGEKVFAEEVEVALKQHSAVYDAVVCGRPSERWGQEVVAIVKLHPDSRTTPDELLAECSKHIARYKLPKSFVFLDEIRRSVSGKPDYDWARAQVAPQDERCGIDNYEHYS
jgi:acyl-CoA synthetase (AMP-forming)/AMP-acid ligase II